MEITDRSAITLHTVTIKTSGKEIFLDSITLTLETLPFDTLTSNGSE